MFLFVFLVEGGTVERKDVREDGQFEIQVETECPLFKGLETCQNVLLTHGDSVDKVADGLQCVAKSSRNIIAAIANSERHLYGVQFHPEVDLTENGSFAENCLKISYISFIINDWFHYFRAENAIQFPLRNLWTQRELYTAAT